MRWDYREAKPSPVTVVAWGLLLFDQRNSVWVGIGKGLCRRGGELDWYAHWVGKRGDRSVEIDTGGVQRVEEINEPVVYKFF